MTDKATFFEKEKLQCVFRSNRPKSGLKEGVFFAIFLSLDHYFLEISYSDSLSQCLTFSRGETHEKEFGTQIWHKQAKISPRISFLPIFKFDS